jgi:hypothetical protein
MGLIEFLGVINIIKEADSSVPFALSAAESLHTLWPLLTITFS